MLSEKLFNLRKKFGLTQESLAEIFGVSRQSVQKWENGACLPDIDKLLQLSEYFNVTIDYLLKDEDDNEIDPMRKTVEEIPSYEKMNEWELYSAALSTEYQQCVDEGKDIQKYKNLFTDISLLKQNENKEKFGDIIFDIVNSAPTADGYEFNEPSDLESIKKLRQKSLPELNKAVPSDEKIRGAWIGRICGCLLGKPIEGISCNELITLLKETDNYPMTRYIKASEIPQKLYDSLSFSLKNKCFIDTVTFAPSDDDTNYTVLANIIVEKYGRCFTPENVAEAWIEYQSKNAYCTAERVAYRNFINGYYPPASAVHKNPYREWIGAQIRADYFGYINPGKPEEAAEMAWRDASISHVKNGIYGEMFVAAVIAAAACVDDIKTALNYGLAEIPATSRLYCAVAEIIKQYESGISAKDWFSDFHTRYNDRNTHDWCHTISNAEIVTASLLYGNGDYTASVCMAVENGFDTDCNGATVGSILGMLNGIASIDKCWYEPINNTLDTTIFGFSKVSIDEIVKKTIEHV